MLMTAAVSQRKEIQGMTARTKIKASSIGQNHNETLVAESNKGPEDQVRRLENGSKHMGEGKDEP
jgi:hypothetical protein